MPAVSKSQKRFFGAVEAAKKGGKAISPKVAKAAKSMSKKTVDEFANGSSKGLPNKVKKVKK